MRYCTKVPESKLDAPILHRLSPDELVLIRAYRVCTSDHQINIRLFAHAAAAKTAEDIPGTVVALSSPKQG